MKYIDDYQSGMSIAEVANKHNVAYSTVRYHLIKNGITIRSQKEGRSLQLSKIYDIDHNVIKTMISEGRTKKSIAEELGCTIKTVSKICKLHNIIKQPKKPKKKLTKEEKSRRTKELWNDPEYRAKQHKIRNTEEYKLQASQRHKKLWADADYKNKVLTYLQSEESRSHKSKLYSGITRGPLEESIKKKISLKSKENWKKEEYRKKFGLGRSKQNRISNIQLSLYEYLRQLNIRFIEEGPETTIGYWTFDCFLPDHNLLIEYQGDYWHTRKTQEVRDSQKFTYIDQYFPQYSILYLWEHEFYCKDRIIERLKSILKIDVKIINFDFSDVKIKKPERIELRSFLDAYHYLNKPRGNICIGAYYKKQLIACCTFSKPIRQNIHEKFNIANRDILELSRFCIHPFYHKKNFASWFISRCLKQVSGKFIIAYADKTVGHVGTIYSASNFKLHHCVKPDYWYIGDNLYVMHKRTLYGRARKNKMTENEYADKFGYRRMYGDEKYCFIRDLR